jgi:hypothetical protein
MNAIKTTSWEHRNVVLMENRFELGAPAPAKTLTPFRCNFVKTLYMYLPIQLFSGVKAATASQMV